MTCTKLAFVHLWSVGTRHATAAGRRPQLPHGSCSFNGHTDASSGEREFHIYTFHFLVLRGLDWISNQQCSQVHLYFQQHTRPSSKKSPVKNGLTMAPNGEKSKMKGYSGDISSSRSSHRHYFQPNGSHPRTGRRRSSSGQKRVSPTLPTNILVASLNIMQLVRLVVSPTGQQQTIWP